MSNKVYSRDGFTHQVEATENGVQIPVEKLMFYNLITDMVDAGFQIVAADTGATISQSGATKKIILRPTLAIDPLYAGSEWCVYLECSNSATIVSSVPGSNANVAVPNTGIYMKIGPASLMTTIARAESAVDTPVSKFTLLPNNFQDYSGRVALDQFGLTDTSPRVSAKGPGAYQLTVVERGFAIAIWTQGITETFTGYTITAVQRGVTCDGTVNAGGQKPLYIVTNSYPVGNTMGGSAAHNRGSAMNSWFYQILQEKDTTVPLPGFVTNTSWPNLSDGHINNSNMIMDPNETRGNTLNYFPLRWFTPVTTDTGEYVLIFPFGLCSSRFAFSDEIDLIAVSKADAYQHGQNVPITVYGNERIYKALNSNNQDQIVNGNGGVRAFILAGGEDFTA